MIHVNSLESLAPYVEQYMLQHIRDAVAHCCSTYNAEEFDTNYTFGTHVWGNLTRRLLEAAKRGEIPFQLLHPLNMARFQIGPYVLRHHRIDTGSKIPRGAHAAKAAANQLSLFDDEDFGEAIRFNENAILAIDATPEAGLIEVFLGFLEKDRRGRSYMWSHKVVIFSATTGIPNSALTPIEPEIEPEVSITPSVSITPIVVPTVAQREANSE